MKQGEKTAKYVDGFILTPPQLQVSVPNQSLSRVRAHLIFFCSNEPQREQRRTVWDGVYLCVCVGENA